MGTLRVQQTDSPVAPGATGYTSLSFPATATNQLKWVDHDGGTNIINGGGFTLTVPATGTVALLATANTFTVQQTIETADNPPFRSIRTTTATTSTSSAFSIIRKTTGDMADTFGVHFSLQGQDDTATANFGQVRAFRSDGTDGNGTLVLGSYLASALRSVLYCFPTAHASINDSSDLAQLYINQSDTGGAVPVLRLGQNDADQPFIRYQGTIAADASTNITTRTVATIAGYIRNNINGTDYWMAYYNTPSA